MAALYDVALPVPVERPFTYKAPVDADSEIPTGVRVVVPFGRRTLTGVVVGRPSGSELPPAKLKPIRDVLDAIPVFTPEMLELAEWMSRYYLSPIGETLRTMLPQGMTTSSRRRVRLRDPEISTADLRRSAPRQAAVVAALRDHAGGCTVSRLESLVGADNLSGLLGTMEEKGIVLIETEEPQSTKPRRKKGARVTSRTIEDEEWAHSLFDELDRRAPKQSALLAYLLGEADRSEPAIVSDLLERAGVSASVLDGLVNKGAVEYVEVEVSREEILDSRLEESAVPHDVAEADILSNPAQQQVIAELESSLGSGFTPFLLHGVTGSGKTHVYIETIRRVIDRGEQAILLVPEIALTVQLVDRFRSVFGDRIVLTHSRMSNGERYDGWRRVARGDCDLVIGPRSALFAPVRKLGLIVVDEEHESSYKQFDAQPRYHARDTAVVRASLEGCPVLLGSATPSIESYHNATTGKYRLLELPDRVDGAREPMMRIVDTKEARKQNLMRSSLSSILISAIRDRITRSEGTILFQNRRGFASRLECTNCGHAPMCDHCAVTLTFHKGIGRLKCHYCGYERKKEASCQVCGQPDLRQPGFGTERVEEDVVEQLPEARVRRMDLDTTTKKGAHRAFLDEFARGEIDVLLGTQMVAKGLDFPRVSLVGVVSADTQLLLPDFRSGERTFQLITQVAGRAGRRSDVPGEVIVQTAHPEHPAIAASFSRDYRSMIDRELADRRELGYPPFSRFVVVEFRSKNEEEASRHARVFRDLLPETDPAFEILGPTAALLWKLRDWYRFHLHIKNFKQTDPGGRRFSSLFGSALRRYRADHASRGVELIVDVDAQGTL